MKNHLVNIIQISFLLLLLLFSSLNAVELANDQFQSGSNSGYSRDNGDNRKLQINRGKTSSKTYDFGSTYANASLIVTFDLNWGEDWENSGRGKDSFLASFNSGNLVEDSFDDDGSRSYSLSPTADSDGRLTIKFTANTTANNEFIKIDNIIITGTPPNLQALCPGKKIVNLHETSVNATDSGKGEIPAYTTYYYYFTPAVDGILQVNSSMNKSWNSLYVQEGCSGSSLWRDTKDSTDKSSPEIAISSGQNIVIAYERRYGNAADYSIYFTYTAVIPTAPVMDDVPDQIGMVGIAFSLNISDFVTGDVDEYTLNPTTLPAGLSWNELTGNISGTPTAQTVEKTYTASASNTIGTSNEDTFTITINPMSIESNGGRNFELRTQSNLFGDVQVIGNTVLCKLNMSGACVEPTSTTDSNADTDLQKAPYSYSTLMLPTDAVVKYARIYWQGRKNDNSSWTQSSKDEAGKIKIRKGNSGTYSELVADIKDFDKTENIPIYSASADALSIVDSSDQYYINTDDFYTVVGDTPDGLGAYGAWVLVVIYEDPNEAQAKNVTIFDGYKQVTQDTGNINISVNGFLTPKSGIVDSETYVFVAEGDKSISGDELKMAGATYNTTLKSLNNTNNAFNSRVDVDGVRGPSLINNNGIDIHKYSTGTNTGAQKIITNNETGAKFQFTSDQDSYFPSLIVFSTQLYLPQLCYDYSIKQDGHYLDIDRNVYPIAQLDSRVSSSPLEVTVYIKNQEADIAAEGIAIKSDLNTTIFSQIGDIYTSNVNGSTLFNRGSPIYSDPLCDYNKDANNAVGNRGCTDGHNIRKGNGVLDAQDYVYTKFFLALNNISNVEQINEPLGLSLKYFITADGTKVEYPDYILGGTNVPICRQSVSYEPTWGYFNIVKSGQSSNTNIVNNIYTQISRKPFQASLVFDSDTATGSNDAPIEDINTTVLVEIIDIDSFGDINASCPNPDANLSAPIVVPINFTSSAFQTNLPQQTSDYYNFAVKNAAFRIWHFNHLDGSLIQNWSAITTNASKTITSIDGLYDPATHIQCAKSCSNATTPGCFGCIKNNYAKAICSRDNFSVRPESYDLRLYDINQTNDMNDLANIDLSTKYGYTPDASVIKRIDLAAEYDYRYDISATGHDGIAYVPGYTRNFNVDGQPASDYNLSVSWQGPDQTTCNDTNDTFPFFYVANGIMQNKKRNHNQVGEYKINIADTSWTAVDWSNHSHHTLSNGFDISNSDCRIDSSASSAVNERHGCIISTNHGSDGGGRVYKDHNVRYHPYTFEMGGVIPSHGQNNDTIFNSKTFIYMADIAQTPNMSFHLNGNIDAVGFKGTRMSNFTKNCYAEDFTLTINKSANLGVISYQYRFENNDTDPTPGVTNINGTTGLIALSKDNFIKANNGRVNTTLNLNFQRNTSIAINPEVVTFSKYDANCTIPSVCSMNVDLAVKSTSGSLNLDQNITHYYGRTHLPRNRFVGQTGEALIYYEVFCDGTQCDKTLLQNDLNSTTTDDPRWFRNESHYTYRDGNAGFDTTQISQKNTAGFVVTTALDENTTDTTNVVFQYDETHDYPYKTTMQNKASEWLIYNKYKADATANEFEIEFVNESSTWAGKTQTDNKTEERGSKKTNRRSMW